MEENNKGNHQKVETNYDENKANPGPSEEAVTEKDDSTVGGTLKWVIGIIVVILLLLWIFL